MKTIKDHWTAVVDLGLAPANGDIAPARSRLSLGRRVQAGESIKLCI
jgi:hypothetical protein